MTYPQVFDFLKITHIIVLKVRKFGEDRLNRFWDIQQKSSGDHLGLRRLKNEKKSKFGSQKISSFVIKKP